MNPGFRVQILNGPNNRCTFVLRVEQITKKPLKKNQPANIFDQRAAQWDGASNRQKIANHTADAIIREVRPSNEMEVLDVGCGTGLLTLRIRPLVHQITGADSSVKMLEVLEQKIREQQLENIQLRYTDLNEGDPVEGRFHLIISSMTLHHLKSIEAVFRQFYEALYPGGYLAFADLDREDGTFHRDNTGVHHLGFDREELKSLLRQTGFTGVHDVTATTIQKEPEREEGQREFTVFLMVGKKA